MKYLIPTASILLILITGWITYNLTRNHYTNACSIELANVQGFDFAKGMKR